MIDQKTLKEILHYNPDTGVFTWRYRDPSYFSLERIAKGWNRRYANTVAGSFYKLGRNTYVYIDVFAKRTAAHRLAFVYMGVPISQSDQVDHIDGNSSNNAFSNLRIVTNSQNCRNQRLRLNNKSGHAGVVRDKKYDGWVASIGYKGKRVYLGWFKDKDMAIKTRQEAESNYNYSPRHGK